MSQRLKERKNKNRQRKTVKQLDSERQTDRQSDGQKQTNTAGSTDIHYWDKEREIKGKTTEKNQM